MKAINIVFFAALFLAGVSCSKNNNQEIAAQGRVTGGETLKNLIPKEGCLDESAISSIKEKITLDGEGWEAFDPCDSKSNTYKMWESLILIKEIVVSKDKVDMGPLNQEILPTDFWGYFTDHVSTIVNESECKPNIVAYVYGMWNDRVVHVCPYFYTDSFNTYVRAETILHEARHFEGYSHVACTRGPRAGDGGRNCDNNIQEKGSYAVTIESLAKMAIMAENIPSPMRAELKNEAIGYDEAFNEPILPQGFQSTYLVSQDKQKAYMYDGLKIIEVPTVSGVKIISRSATLAAFPLDKSDAYTLDTYSKNFDKLPAQGSYSKEYNSKPVGDRPEVLDVVNGTYGTGVLTTDLLEFRVRGGMNPDPKNTKIPLGFKPEKLYMADEIGFEGKDSAYVLSAEGKLYQFKLTGDEGGYQFSEVQNSLGDIQGVAKINNVPFVLNKNGDILKKDANGWVTIDDLGGLKFDSMTRSFYWTEYFAEGIIK